MNESTLARFQRLSTPLVSDAVMQAGLPLRIAPMGLRQVNGAGAVLAGPVLAARHRGSVDVFLEAMERARGGELLVIDNQGRLDEGCMGDLVAIEAWQAGLAGIVVWGCHRDTAELQTIPLPVFSYGAYPAGPARSDALVEETSFGDVRFREGEQIFVDGDGAIFLESEHVEAVLKAAEEIARKERAQADEVRNGRSLREQLRFGEYLAQRRADPTLTLRRHLQRVGGAVEV